MERIVEFKTESHEKVKNKVVYYHACFSSNGYINSNTCLCAAPGSSESKH
ncbi:MAG: hypothetical protein ACOC11_01330 [Prolixibacteraceae bacterium]